MIRKLIMHFSTNAGLLNSSSDPLTGNTDMSECSIYNLSGFRLLGMYRIGPLTHCT